MAAKRPAPTKTRTTKDRKGTQAYDHEEKLLLRPDVGLQSQFKQKKQPKTYRYDPSLDPALSWDGSADRERAEALIARIDQATDLTEAKLAAAELRRMSRPFRNSPASARYRQHSTTTVKALAASAISAVLSGLVEAAVV